MVPVKVFQGFWHALAMLVLNFISSSTLILLSVSRSAIFFIDVCFLFNQNLLRREPLKLVDGGESQRTFIYIKDAIEAVLLMIVCLIFSLFNIWQILFLSSVGNRPV